MSALIVNSLGLVMIAFIVGWFWLIKPRAVIALNNLVEILVQDGVYQPSRIEVPAGKPVTLRFLRKDPGHCAEKVIFRGLGISADLPLHRPYDMTIEPKSAGEYEFTCEMQMYRGRLIVK